MPTLLNEEFYMVEIPDNHSPITISHDFDDFNEEFCIVDIFADEDLISSVDDDKNFEIIDAETIPKEEQPDQEFIQNVIDESDALLEKDKIENQNKLDSCVKSVDEGDELLLKINNSNEARVFDILFVFFIMGVSVLLKDYMFYILKSIPCVLSIVNHLLSMIMFPFLLAVLLLIIYCYGLEKYIIIFCMGMQEFKNKNTMDKIFFLVYLLQFPISFFVKKNFEFILSKFNKKIN